MEAERGLGVQAQLHRWLSSGQSGVAVRSLGSSLYFKTECRHFSKDTLNLTK